MEKNPLNINSVIQIITKKSYQSPVASHTSDPSKNFIKIHQKFLSYLVDRQTDRWTKA